ncbi:MAG: acetylornithine deacetylase [Devosia sp.]
MTDVAGTIELLERLVAFPTISSASNLALIDYVEDYLSSRGAHTWRFPNVSGEKASLFAAIGAGGPPVLLSGHTDVVPVAGQAWSSDPFRLTERSGKLTGRGTADMKGFLACMLTAADAVSRGSFHRSLQLAFSYDEEVGCKGVDELLGHIMESQHKPTLCVVGEPTRMRVAVGHKGKVAATVRCKGIPGHSSDPAHGINAIGLAGEVISILSQHEAALRLDGPFAPRYDPPHSTLNLGRINGGTQVNVIAAQCDLEFEIRNVPGHDATLLLGAVAEQCNELALRHSNADHAASITVDVVTRYPALETRTDQLAGWRYPLGEDHSCVSYGSEAGLFAAIEQFPVVVCGPGDIAQAHRADEFIEKEQLAACCRFISQTLDVPA